jgi:hypothetical protein
LSRGDELLQFFDVGKSNIDSEHLSTTSGYYAVDGGPTATQEPDPLLFTFLPGSPSDVR